MLHNHLLLLFIAIFNIHGTAYPFARGCTSSRSKSHSRKGESSSMLAQSSSVSYLTSEEQTSVTSEQNLKNARPPSLISVSSIRGSSYLEQPRLKSNLFNRVTYGWVDELLKKGNKRPDSNPLELSDIWKLDSKSEMGNISARFDDFYSKEIARKTSTRPSNNILMEFWSYPVTRAIVKMYKKEFLRTGLLKFLNTCVQFLPSLVIARILKLVSVGGVNVVTAPKSYISKGISLSVALLFILSTKTFLENAYFFEVINLAASVRGALSTAIYRKSLRLNPQGRQNFTVGEISNYIQLDTNRMEQVAGSIHTVWDGIFQIVGYTSLLLAFLGPSVFAGIVALLVIIPLNAYFLDKLSATRSVILKYTDNRVKLTSEILQGIRAIKSYNWETPFLIQLNILRDNEIKAMKRAANIRAILVSMLSAAPSLVAVVTLSLYAFLGNDLNPMKVFSALALFNQLRFPIIFFPLLLNTLADGKVSLKRISSFLQSSEIQNYVENNPIEDSAMTSRIGSIDIRDGDFAWSTNNDTSLLSRGRLRNINLSIKPGELVAVIGPVGSGKSMMISALLGELACLNGTVRMNGRVAYVPQSAWIPNDSLRNVILFGRTYNEISYNNTVTSCGLVKDLSNFETGDSTEIGERGVNLSGGQKQRVSIARAVYDDADIYLFDDPLSALDADVRQSVFNHCIDGILSNKTRLLVTHQLNILSEVDRIIIMNVKTYNYSVGDSNFTAESCEIIDQGNLRDLYRRGYDLSKLVNSTESSSDKPTQTMTIPIVQSGLSSDASDATSLALDCVIDDKNIGEGDFIDSLSTRAVSQNRDDIDCINDAEVSKGSISDDPLNYMDEVGAIKESDYLNYTDFEVSNCVGLATSDAVINSTAPRLKANNLNRRLLPGSSMPLPSHTAISSNAMKSVKINEDKVDEPTKQQSNIKDVPLSPIVTKKLISIEERGEGAVGWPVYKQYFSVAKSPLLIFAILASFAVANVAQIAQLWIVSAWTADVGYKKYPLHMYLSGMAFMAAAVAFFNWSRTYMTYLVGANASKSLHFNMAKSVLRAPLNFFESTPVGRLMQRFSKDLDSMDQQLPGSFGQLVASALNIFGAMMAVCVATPSFAFVMAPVFTIYILLTNYYRKVARELKRLDSVSRSPIYAHFGETVGGLSVIRSFQREKIFLRTNEVKLDDNLSSYYTLKAVDRWLSLRLEILGNILVFFSSLLAVMSGSKAGVTGISLNNALSITSLLNWAVRNGAETESLMNSVERVLYTSINTPSEYKAAEASISMKHGHVDVSAMNLTDSSMTESDLLTSAWPWKGGVVFENVKMSYREDFDPILKGVNIAIRPGERIGVVGRTGSGKSSLFRALLRLTEIDHSGGIYIDGVNIRSIGMNTLRSAISIIPQDPVLFSGSLRFNLDPFNLRTDEELWLSLRKANLEQTVRSLPGGLNFIVSEGGENFSAGQRQLICLARALVRKSKLLLLDEATSSLDHDTDTLIQKAIRDEFSRTSSTVLTIAHRLDTIVDADRILVMEHGRVAEFDTPANLLRKPKSLFAQLMLAENKQKKRNQNKISTITTR